MLSYDRNGNYVLSTDNSGHPLLPIPISFIESLQFGIVDIKSSTLINSKHTYNSGHEVVGHELYITFEFMGATNKIRRMIPNPYNMPDTCIEVCREFTAQLVEEQLALIHLAHTAGENALRNSVKKLFNITD